MLGSKKFVVRPWLSPLAARKCSLVVLELVRLDLGDVEALHRTRAGLPPGAAGLTHRWGGRTPTTFWWV